MKSQKVGLSKDSVYTDVTPHPYLVEVDITNLIIQKERIIHCFFKIKLASENACTHLE